MNKLPTTSQSQISFFPTNQPSNHSNFTVVFNIPILARMFAKSFLAVSVLFSSAALVTQLVQGIPTDSPPSTSCSTGTQQCCNQVVDSHNAGVAGIAGLLGIVLGDLTGLVGLGCTPIVGNAGCSAEVTCCQDNSHGNIISLGCSKLF
ncbi:hypothetical protein C8Q75DRAFT_786476 [Abortiporus biennis]|nr:hypothetical protein C8Q75DRAFT_786476 [Abortiporus biennis]